MIVFETLLKNHLVEFLKWTCPSSTFGMVHFQFWGYLDEYVSCPANNCTDVQFYTGGKD